MIEINDGMPDFETVWKNSFGQTQESLTENFRVYKTAENGDDESLENSCELLFNGRCHQLKAN